MTLPDYYSVLGVLPQAEAIVISAAYRALAQRYHPDKWQGDPADAHRRMSEINEAYRVLSDQALREEYDAKRSASAHASYQAEDSEDADRAFDAALRGLEDRWSVAVGVFPDLTGMRASLATISTSLAFAFVTVLLDTRKFNARSAIAETLERQFLSRYFGTNDDILSYARELIYGGHRGAAKMLNELVDVMGSDVDPALLIERVEQRYQLRAKRVAKHAIEKLAAEVQAGGYFDDACRLAKALGYTVREQSTGFLGAKLDIAVTSPQGKVWEVCTKRTQAGRRKPALGGLCVIARSGASACAARVLSKLQSQRTRQR